MKTRQTQIKQNICKAIPSTITEEIHTVGNIFCDITRDRQTDGRTDTGTARQI